MLVTERLKRLLIAEACLARALGNLKEAGGCSAYQLSSLRGQLSAVRDMAAALKAEGRFPLEAYSRMKRESVLA